MIKLIIENVEQLTDEIGLIPATNKDLDLIIEAELFTTKASYVDGKIPKDVVEEIIQDAKDSIEHTRMITYKNEIIGILQAYELEGYWYIGEIYLIEKYRGQGIGKIVLQNEINNHKDKTLCLNVYKNNTHAIELYKSLGFEITEDSDGRYIMKLFNDDYITNSETIEAMKEAEWLLQGNGKKNMKPLKNFGRMCLNMSKLNKLGLTENLKRQYKLHIKETYELAESNKPNVFNNNSRETYGDLINPNSKVGNVTTHDYYKFEKGKDAILSYMTADEYIDRCINKVFKSNYTKTVTNAVDWDKVNKYAELMKQGTIFPTPYLDYVNAGQEGRHRALAFKQAFGEDAEMPVIELYPSNPTLDEIYDYCTQKWQDGEQWMEYVAPNFGYTTKEIYDYLGKEYIEPEEDEEQEDYIDVDIDIDDDDDIDIDEFNEFNEFVKDKSNGEITDVYKLPADEFMKWLTKFTKYYN